MKRTLFIIGGVSIICILVGVWAYFLFFGTPNPDGGVFANFNLGNTDDPSVVIPVEPEPTEPLVDVTSPERLRQLTTQPVAGFAEVQLTPSSTPQARYIEAGTGHIYSIDLKTGVETRISATTIPLTNTGAMTPNGQYAMIQSGSGIGSEHVIGIVSTTSDELRNFAIPGNITSFAATTENTFMYTTPVGNELVARAYDPSTNAFSELFRIPFRDASVDWGYTETGPHYVYPHTTSRLEGYVYSYTNGVATREPASGYGLSVVGSSAGYIYSEVMDGEYNTYTFDKVIDETSIAPINTIPEKCTFAKNIPNRVVCGFDLTSQLNQMPDTWHKGDVRMNDSLWEYSIGSQSAGLLISPEDVTGRQLDIMRLQFGINDTNLYFQNKTDHTLWIYEDNIFDNLN